MNVFRVSEAEGGSLREVRNTQVSLVIAAVFLVSHSVRWLPNIWELRQAGSGVVRIDPCNVLRTKIFQNISPPQEKIHWPGWVHSISQVSHLLTVFNSSINFYIYLAKQGCSKLIPASYFTRLELTDMVGIIQSPLGTYFYRIYISSDFPLITLSIIYFFSVWLTKYTK